MMRVKDNILLSKCHSYGDRIVKMSSVLKSRKADHNLIDQVTRCGTSIGANVSESVYAESKTDFIHKLRISLKEAKETLFWLQRLHTAESITMVEMNSMVSDLNEIIYILVASINTSIKNKNGDND